jgi:hypothetical protein
MQETYDWLRLTEYPFDDAIDVETYRNSDARPPRAAE